MLTYEHVVTILLGSIERTGLNVVHTQELLDTHALTRSLSITCLPQGVDDDRTSIDRVVRATVGFRWSPEFTVTSLRGEQGGDPAAGDDPPRRSRATLEVDLVYTLPLSPNQSRDLSGAPLLVRAVQELHAEVSPGGSTALYEVPYVFASSQPARVRAIVVHHLWPFSGMLSSPESLGEQFDALCAELYLALETFAMHFGSPADHHPADPRYLKPPTA